MRFLVAALLVLGLSGTAFAHDEHREYRGEGFQRYEAPQRYEEPRHHDHQHSHWFCDPWNRCYPVYH